MTPLEALEAMLHDTTVWVDDGPPCRVDSVYRSVDDGTIRVRASDRYGLVHHYPPARLTAGKEAAPA